MRERVDAKRQEAKLHAQPRVTRQQGFTVTFEAVDDFQSAYEPSRVLYSSSNSRGS